MPSGFDFIRNDATNEMRMRLLQIGHQLMQLLLEKSIVMYTAVRKHTSLSNVSDELTRCVAEIVCMLPPFFFPPVLALSSSTTSAYRWLSIRFFDLAKSVALHEHHTAVNRDGQRLLGYVHGGIDGIFVLL